MSHKNYITHVIGVCSSENKLQIRALLAITSEQNLVRLKILQDHAKDGQHVVEQRDSRSFTEPTRLELGKLNRIAIFPSVSLTNGRGLTLIDPAQVCGLRLAYGPSPPMQERSLWHVH